MKNEARLTVRIDANVYISALAFGGKPLKVVERALAKDFSAVTSQMILQEVQKNLTGKLGLNTKRVGKFIDDILGISSVYVPSGRLKIVGHAADDAVIETALLGQADVLVTGDKKHLLHLGKYQNEETGITRQAIYKMLSGEGNPTLKNVTKLLEAVGLELTVKKKSAS